MKFTKEIESAIKNFIIEQLPAHSNDIVDITKKHFEISKPTATKYVNILIEEKIVQKQKQGRYPHYSLVKNKKVFTYFLKNNLEEDVIWRKDIAPLLDSVKKNVKNALQYSFTEMVNNVIDHAQAEKLLIEIDIDALNVMIDIYDDGIGIFKKIQTDLNLDDPKHAILELAKGKFTSDPEHHSGEGIFFTSRICDSFAIRSDNLSFFSQHNDDWLLEGGSSEQGTLIRFIMSKNSTVNIADIFNEYSDPDKCPSFHKTHVPVKLMEYEGELLLSRSQAKRLINRFDRFLEVLLDFDGVTEIGQGFADEIFRVFQNAHPNVNIVPINCNKNVQKMISHISTDYFT